jgi:hypothetical protein
MNLTVGLAGRGFTIDHLWLSALFFYSISLTLIEQRYSSRQTY